MATYNIPQNLDAALDIYVLVEGGTKDEALTHYLKDVLSAHADRILPDKHGPLRQKLDALLSA